MGAFMMYCCVPLGRAAWCKYTVRKK